jgi:hypothetical protein
MVKFFTKNAQNKKKYMVITPKGKTVHFGHTDYQQFKDSTGLGLYSHMDHGDKKRRQNYLRRSAGIRNAQGKLTANDPESANYYARRFLW